MKEIDDVKNTGDLIVKNCNIIADKEKGQNNMTIGNAEDIIFSQNNLHAQNGQNNCSLENTGDISTDNCTFEGTVNISLEKAGDVSLSGNTFNHQLNMDIETEGELSFNSCTISKNSFSVENAEGDISFNGCVFSDTRLNVNDFGAVGDGNFDNTEAFQKALNTAFDMKYQIVYVPNGNYLFKGHLNIPIGVTLQGTRTSVPANNGIRDAGLPLPTDGGSTLMPTEHAGNENGESFITLNTNSTLTGFVIYYPNQSREEVPISYPWTVAMRGKNPAILDCELLNPYNGIDASQNERHLVRNISGQPLRRGIFTDFIYDIGRWENIHFNPWYSMKGDLWQWQLANGEAFIFGKSDWHYVINCFCFGYAIGYKFIETEFGCCNGNFVGIGADGCNKSVVVEAANPLGLLITNGEFVAMFWQDPIMVHVPKTNIEGVVMFENCAFWGPCHKNAVIEAGKVTFNNCNFVHWDFDNRGSASVNIKGGDVIISNSRFQEDKVPVEISENAKALVFTSNILKTEKQIVNNSTSAKIAEGLNIYGID